MQIIGTLVKVKALAEKDFVFEEGKKFHTYVRWVSRPIEPLYAIITGCGHRYEGVYYPASRSGYYGEEHEPAYLEVRRTQKVILVRFSLTTNEKPVFEHDIEVISATNGGYNLPYRQVRINYVKD